MSVGLYDADMATYVHTAPNLELMKYSAYYKNKGEITVLSPLFNPALFNTFVYRKDYDDGDFPDLLKYDNILYGGLSYSNNKYIPLPEEIETLVPDTSIYDKMMDNFGDFKKNRETFKKCLNCRHMRLSLDGKTIWGDFEKQIDASKGCNYFFHDYDLNKIKDSEVVIKKMLEKNPEKQVGINAISTKFPIQVYNEEDMEKWIYFRGSAAFFNLNYYGLMSTDYFKHFLKVSPLQNSSKSIQYIVTYGFKDQQDFVDNGVEKMYDQFIIACTNRKRISLIYDDNFFTDKIWEDFFLLLDLFNGSLCEMNPIFFTNGRKKNSLYKFVQNFKSEYRYKRSLTIERAREIFAYMRVANYNLFKKFYESCLTEIL